MRLSTPSVASIKTGAKAVAKWIVGGGLLLFTVTFGIQLHFARQDAREATIQTYNLSRVAAFRDSGAELDKKVAAFNDAAAESQSLSEPRQAVRSALVDHAAKTFAMQDDFGAEATAQYTADLKALQSAVEATNDHTTPGPIITAMSRMLVDRNRMAEAVTKKAAN
jgi:hypothetical protein